MKSIWIIRHIDQERLGHLPDVLNELGLPYRSISLSRGDALPPLEEVAGVITMGGPMSSYHTSEHEWIAREEAFVRQVHEQGTPLLAICLGAQILAQAFGAQVSKAAECEIGWLPLRRTGAPDRLLEGLELPLLFQYHYDVFDLPAGAVSLLTSDRTAHQMFRLGDTSYGTQFHPEANEEMLNGVIKAYADKLSVGMLDLMVENMAERSQAGRVFLLEMVKRLFCTLP